MTKPDIVERLDRATEDFWSHTRIDVIREARAEIERLKAGLQMLAKQEYDAGYTPEGFAEAILSGDEPALEPKP